MTGITAMFMGGTSLYYIGVFSGSSVGDLALAYDGTSPYAVLGGKSSGDGLLYPVNILRTSSWARQQYYPFASSIDIVGVATDSTYNTISLASIRTSDLAPTIVKTSTTGTLTWQYKLSDSGNDVYGADVAVDASDNVLTCGYESNFLYVAKRNSSGTLQWQRTLSSATANYDCYGAAIAADTLGDIVVGGQAREGGTYLDPFLTKYNSAGTVSWQKRITGLAGGTGLVLGVTTDSSNNIYALIAGATTGGSYYLYYMKLDSSGAIQWTRRHTTTHNTYSGGGVYLGSDGYLYFCTNTTIVKLDTSGTVQWQRSITATVKDIVADNREGMWVVGSLSGSVFLARLPTDGTSTGTYDLGGTSVTYAATTDTIGTYSATTATTTFTDAAGTFNTGTGPLSTFSATITSTTVSV